jgi:polyphenol oxidase
LSSVFSMALDDAPGARSCDIPVIPDMPAGITLAAAGDMALSRDRSLPWRSRFAAARGIPRERLYGLKQVHSRSVLVIEGQTPDQTATIEADGLITMSADAVLSVTVADCLPIFLADRRTGAFGIVHSGWRGTGIVREALALMASRFGSRPDGIAAVIGTGIGACCYAVPEERAALFASEYGPHTIVRDQQGNPRLDLRAANIRLLEDAGVEEIRVVTDCTSCSEKLGSFRRQGPAGYTLMLAWIGRQGALADGTSAPGGLPGGA